MRDDCCRPLPSRGDSKRVTLAVKYRLVQVLPLPQETRIILAMLESYRMTCAAKARTLRLETWAAMLVLAGLVGSPATFGQEHYALHPDRNWERLDSPDPASPEGSILAIRKLVAAEEGKAAQTAATEWIEANPNHVLIPEAHLLRGDALVVRRRYYEALFDYEYLAQKYPDSPQFHTTLERQFTIANLFASGMRRRLWGMRVLRANGEAEEIFIRIQERAPGSALGEEAGFALADFYFGRAEMNSAAEAYDLFLKNYPRSSRRERAMLQLIRANLATFKGPRFDAAGLIEASERLEDYQQQFPAGAEELGADALLVRIEESLAQKAFYTGRWFEGRGEGVSAKYVYERVIRDYPQTAAAKEAMRYHQRISGQGAGEPVGGSGSEPNPESDSRLSPDRLRPDSVGRLVESES